MGLNGADFTGEIDLDDVHPLIPFFFAIEPESETGEAAFSICLLLYLN